MEKSDFCPICEGTKYINMPYGYILECPTCFYAKIRKELSKKNKIEKYCDESWEKNR